MSGPTGAQAAPVQAMLFSAADVPRVRDRLMEHLVHSLEPLLTVHPDKMHLPYHPGRTDRDGYKVAWSIPEYVAAVQRWLRTAELFYVTRDMTQVVRQAAEAMPTYQVWEDQLPSDIGFALYGEPFASVTADRDAAMEPGERCELTGVLWARIDDAGEGPGLLLVTFQDSEVLIGTRWLAEAPLEVQAKVIPRPVAYHEEVPLPFGNDSRVVRNSAVGAFMSTLIMMSQRITVEEHERAPRALRRAYERENRPEPVVRTVTLRRTGGKPGQEREPGREASREYQHRWVVRGYGYWRNTWYPSAQTHRLQFVHVPPYVKGPDGAPFIGGERVNVLRR